MDIRVGGKYSLLKRIGNGSFGEVYQGINYKKKIGIDTVTKEYVAIKLVIFKLNSHRNHLK